MVRQPQQGPADQKAARVLVELSRHWMAWGTDRARGDYEREATSATWEADLPRQLITLMGWRVENEGGRGRPTYR